MFYIMDTNDKVHGKCDTLDIAQKTAKSLSKNNPGMVFNVVKIVWSCGSIEPESTVKAGEFDWDNPKPDPYNF